MRDPDLALTKVDRNTYTSRHLSSDLCPMSDAPHQSMQRQPWSALLEKHAFQLLLMHEEAQWAWEELRERPSGSDPEQARKLAVKRRELLHRHKNIPR